MAEKFAYYPMEVDRFDESQRVRSMSLDEVGLYLLCLNRSWKYGSLPDDVEQIALDVRRKIADVRKAWPAVRACYVPLSSDPSRLINEVQEEKRAKVSEKTGKAKEAAAKRWNQKKTDADALPTHMHSHMPTHCERNADADANAMPRAFSFVSSSVSSSLKSFIVDADRLRREYPKEIDDEDMRHFVSYVETEEQQAAFFANLPLHAANWKRGYEVKLENYMRKGTWKITPKTTAPATKPADFTESQLAQLEAEAKLMRTRGW